MINQLGSQMRQKIEDTSYIVRAKKGCMVSLECGDHREVWVANDGFAGYTLEINGVGYEFISSHYENTDF